jgi:alpha-mannosidase
VRTDFGLNTFQILDESPNGMAAWHIGYTMKEEYLLDGAKVELVEKGPVFAIFRVTRAFRSSKIVEDVIIYNCLNRVDFVANIDWREIGDSKAGVPDLKVGFTASMKAPRTRLEGPFTVYETPADGTEKPTQKFADVTGSDFGFTLYNDSKYGVDALGNRLRLTLLRNGYNPDPESDNGRHIVKFAFAPHGPKMSNGELVRGGMSFNRPLLAVVTNSRPRKPAPMLVIDGAESVVCTALRRSEYSKKTVVRLFETSGKAARATVKLGAGITSAEVVNFLENPVDDNVKLANGKVVLNFRPFEVKTLLVMCKGL